MSGTALLTRREAPEVVVEAAAAQTGPMIALVPSPADLDRLAVSGGEPQDELHLTLWYLGEADGYPLAVREGLANAIRLMVQRRTLPVVRARAFGANLWNPAGEEPAWVLAVGDLPDDERPDGQERLAAVREMMRRAWHDGLVPIEPPAQHSPWVPHICLAYFDDPDLLKQVARRVGPVTFDRVRIAFAGETIDIPLTAPLAPRRSALAMWQEAGGVDWSGGDPGWVRRDHRGRFAGKGEGHAAKAAGVASAVAQATELVDSTGRPSPAARRMSAVDTSTPRRQELAAMRVDQLRASAKERGLSGYSRANKARLVDMLADREAVPTSDVASPAPTQVGAGGPPSETLDDVRDVFRQAQDRERQRDRERAEAMRPRAAVSAARGLAEELADPSLDLSDDDLDELERAAQRVLDGVRRRRASGNVPSAPRGGVTAAQEEIRAAVARLAAPNAWVGLADVRRELGDRYSRAEVDEALARMNREVDVHVIPHSQQGDLTDEDRNAEVVIGNLRRHLIRIAPASTQASDAPRQPTAVAHETQLLAAARDLSGVVDPRDPPFVGIADLRDRLGGMSRDEQDQAMLSLMRQGAIRIVPVANRKSLTSRDRQAAIRIGDEDNEVVQVMAGTELEQFHRPSAAPDASLAGDPRVTATVGRLEQLRQAVHDDDRAVTTDTARAELADLSMAQLQAVYEHFGGTLRWRRKADLLNEVVELSVGRLLTSRAIMRGGRMVEAAGVGLTEAAGHDDERLHHYWTRGEGRAKWVGHLHPWTALYRHLVKHVGPERAKRMASQWHKEVFGIWVGEKAREKGNVGDDHS